MSALQRKIDLLIQERLSKEQELNEALYQVNASWPRRVFMYVEPSINSGNSPIQKGQQIGLTDSVIEDTFRHAMRNNLYVELEVWEDGIYNIIGVYDDGKEYKVVES
jgi:hypothetical protein